MNDIVIVLSEIETDSDTKESYPITKVHRYDFQGSEQDLLDLINSRPDLFIEGGKMRNS